MLFVALSFVFCRLVICSQVSLDQITTNEREQQPRQQQQRRQEEEHEEEEDEEEEEQQQWTRFRIQFTTINNKSRPNVGFRWRESGECHAPGLCSCSWVLVDDLCC